MYGWTADGGLLFRYDAGLARWRPETGTVDLVAADVPGSLSIAAR